jgi:hypothetical protein
MQSGALKDKVGYFGFSHINFNLFIYLLAGSNVLVFRSMFKLQVTRFQVAMFSLGWIGAEVKPRLPQGLIVGWHCLG